MLAPSRMGPQVDILIVVKTVEVVQLATRRSVPLDINIHYHLCKMHVCTTEGGTCNNFCAPILYGMIV